jgi:hypothetical protein
MALCNFTKLLNVQEVQHSREPYRWNSVIARPVPAPQFTAWYFIALFAFATMIVMPPYFFV